MSLFKMGELKLLWNFYIYLVFWTFSLMIQPYIFVYFRDLGFNFTQIASFTSAMMISLFLFEVPTGIVADLWGRKNSVFIGLIIVGIAPIIVALSTNYFVILVSYIAIGLGITFISGAEEALIVDNLKFHGRDDLIKEYYIKFSSLMGLGSVVSFSLGALIVEKFGITPLWYIWGGGYLFSAILLIGIKEHRGETNNGDHHILKKMITPVKESLRYIKGNRTFLNYLLGSTFVTVMFVQRDIWNIFLVENGIRRSYLSLIATATAALTIVLPWLTRFFKNSSVRKVLVATTILRVGILISALAINSQTLYLGVILFVILGSISSFESPITSTYVQNSVDSEIRATMGSFMSMIFSIVGGVAGIAIGILTDLVGLRISIVSFGVFGLISLYYYLRMKEREDEF